VPLRTVEIVLYNTSGGILYQVNLQNTFAELRITLEGISFEYIEKHVDVPKEYTGLA
jgi:hypothetical protein